jgi:2-keto-3-deoxy-L-rhamnonate aldolase RhmA
MKASSLQAFRRKLATGAPLYGLWVTLEAASITDIATGLGLDWVVIDAEHGQMDWGDILEHVRATARSGTIALVCVSEATPGLIPRALDIGADGVVVSGVETASQLRSIIKEARQLTQGPRSIGRQGAAQPHLDEAALVVPIIESARAIRNLGTLLNVEGTEIFFFHPVAHRTSSGESRNPDETAFATADDRIVGMIQKQGKRAGVVAPNREHLLAHRDRGFSLLGLGLDGDIILGGIRDRLAVVDKPLHVDSPFAPGGATGIPSGVPK